jgi:hypothetical protein
MPVERPSQRNPNVGDIGEEVAHNFFSSLDAALTSPTCSRAKMLRCQRWAEFDFDRGSDRAREKRLARLEGLTVPPHASCGCPARSPSGETPTLVKTIRLHHACTVGQMGDIGLNWGNWGVSWPEEEVVSFALRYE